MKTLDILSMDCRETENKKLLNRFLLKIPEVNKNVEKQNVPIEILEKVVQSYRKKGYKTEPINSYYEPETGRSARFIYYNVSVLHNGKWIGEIYGVTLWEVLGKTIIKIYADQKERERKGLKG